MDKIIPISDFQSRAKKYVEQVKKTEEPIIVTQRGRAAAMLVSCEVYEGLLATQEETSYPDWRQRLKRARRESREGKAVALAAYLQKRKRRA
ncbi:MAG: type II toxin-antitoxin system Phd/YefM family antitoxin [Elusimicrobia bacterium]|nr:type II toxin-antitoxin system Phd/YefM family antitoxin [Elusimicrobiota bacterium]